MHKLRKVPPKKKVPLEKKEHIVVVDFFWCFAGLPPTVLLLYWVGLPSAVLGSSVLSKGVETGQTGTQIGPVCAQIIPRLPGACLRQVELF